MKKVVGRFIMDFLVLLAIIFLSDVFHFPVFFSLLCILFVFFFLVSDFFAPVRGKIKESLQNFFVRKQIEKLNQSFSEIPISQEEIQAHEIVKRLDEENEEENDDLVL